MALWNRLPTRMSSLYNSMKIVSSIHGEANELPTSSVDLVDTSDGLGFSKIHQTIVLQSPEKNFVSENCFFRWIKGESIFS